MQSFALKTFCNSDIFLAGADEDDEDEGQVHDIRDTLTELSDCLALFRSNLLNGDLLQEGANQISRLLDVIVFPLGIILEFVHPVMTKMDQLPGRTEWQAKKIVEDQVFKIFCFSRISRH